MKSVLAKRLFALARGHFANVFFVVAFILLVILAVCGL